MRAASQAYRQALVNAQRTGVASEAANAVGGGARAAFGGRGAMRVEEAREVLGVSEGATYEEVHARFERLFESNEKSGSFYLQSKIYRARESLDGTYDEEEVKKTLAEAEARRAARRAEEEAATAATRAKEGEGEA